MSQQPVYTSQTGVESVDTPIIEHVAPARVRMTDASYGLATGAKRTHDLVAKELFARQKAEAIARQAGRELAKREMAIRQVTTDINRLRTSLIANTCSDKVKAAALLTTLEAKRARLVRK